MMQRISWNDPRVPISLRHAVKYLNSRDAFWQHDGVTVGHFCARIGPSTFIGSNRRDTPAQMSEGPWLIEQPHIVEMAIEKPFMVHFHSPIRPHAGCFDYGGLIVWRYFKDHGPNIYFDTDAYRQVTWFCEDNFDLEQRTKGLE